MIYGNINTDDTVILRKNGGRLEAVGVDGCLTVAESNLGFNDIVAFTPGFVQISTACIVASKALLMYHQGGWVSVRGVSEKVRVTTKFVTTVASFRPDDENNHYRAGFKAKVGGWSKEVCPFKKSKPEYVEWHQGWDDGPSYS